MFSFSPFFGIFSIVWEFLFILGIFRNKILGFLKIQSGTTDVIHLFPRRAFPIGGPLRPSLYLLTVSQICNGECDAKVDMTLYDL